MKTQVVFRKFKDTNDIVALFPNENWATENDCASYMHVGQHGAADFNHCIKLTVAASPEDYQALKTELEGLGYDLEIRKRRSKPRASKAVLTDETVQTVSA